jgi:hypothetical protein
MFVFAADVQLGLEVSGNSSARAFKFGITHDEVDFEAALAIDAMDAFHGFDERVFCSVVEDLRGDETDVSGIDIKNGILFTNIISMHRVMLRYCCMMPCGMLFATAARVPLTC